MNPSITIWYGTKKLRTSEDVTDVRVQIWYQSGKCINVRVANTGAIRID